jgi:rhodanese-related sulfurtransferase
MNIYQRTLRIISSAGLFLILLLVSTQAQSYPGLDKEQYVTSKTLKSWIKEGKKVTLLDVRAEDEFEAGRLRNARNILYSDVSVVASELPQDQPIVTYCIHSAHRAPEAAKALLALGFSDVYVLEGGIVSWQAEGSPIYAGDLAKAPVILPKTERCEPLQQATS